MTKKYVDMTVPECWEWHASVYAFRRVVLDIDERTSPCDAEGVWFNAGLVDAAERRLRAKRAPVRRASDEEMQREGRAIANAWARRHGCVDIEQYRLMERLTYTEALARISRAILAGNQMDDDPEPERPAEFVMDDGGVAAWADTL